MMEVIWACVSRVRSSRSCAEASAGRARARSASARVVAFMRIGRLGLSDNARMPLAKPDGQTTATGDGRRWSRRLGETPIGEGRCPTAIDSLLAKALPPVLDWLLFNQSVNTILEPRRVRRWSARIR